ncbi:hypothetical protein VCHENC02_3281A, partial [Vibrio harveyi]
MNSTGSVNENPTNSLDTFFIT